MFHVSFYFSPLADSTATCEMWDGRWYVFILMLEPSALNVYVSKETSLNSSVCSHEDEAACLQVVSSLKRLDVPVW